MTDKKYAVVIGIGLALFPLHNVWLAEHSRGILFLPAWGSAIWIMATLLYLRDNWKTLDWGPRQVYIPLSIIAGAIALSGVTAPTLAWKFAPGLMALSMLALYLVSRKLGKGVFLPLALGTVIACLGVVASALLNPGHITGGLVFENNYDIVVGYTLLGAVLGLGHITASKRPICIYYINTIGFPLVLVAMFLTGSPEGVFSVAVLLLVILWRRDWGKKLALSAAVVALGAAVLFATGYGQKLYTYIAQVATLQPTLDVGKSGWLKSHLINEETPLWVESALGYRIGVIDTALSNMKPLGDGYNITQFNKTFVHNVPLIIVQQLGWSGIAAAVAWLWVAIWCLVKTKWKYAWILVLSLSLFDHFVWTQLAPLFWTIAGVSTATVGNIHSDLIFKEARNG